jgi:hypothetical protein
MTNDIERLWLAQYSMVSDKPIVCGVNGPEPSGSKADAVLKKRWETAVRISQVEHRLSDRSAGIADRSHPK